MPDITARQVETKWKNITYRFNRYEDNRINSLGMRMKIPIGYDMLRTFLEVWTDSDNNGNVKNESGKWKDENDDVPDIIISGSPEYVVSESDGSSDSGENKPRKKQKTEHKNSENKVSYFAFLQNKKNCLIFSL